MRARVSGPRSKLSQSQEEDWGLDWGLGRETWDAIGDPKQLFSRKKRTEIIEEFEEDDEIEGHTHAW